MLILTAESHTQSDCIWQHWQLEFQASNQSCFGGTPVTASVIFDMSSPLAASITSYSATWTKASQIDQIPSLLHNQHCLNLKVGLTILFFMRGVVMWLGSFSISLRTLQGRGRTGASVKLQHILEKSTECCFSSQLSVMQSQEMTPLVPSVTVVSFSGGCWGELKGTFFAIHATLLPFLPIIYHSYS